MCHKKPSVKEIMTNHIFTIRRGNASLNIHIYIATLATLKLLLDKTDHVFKAGKIFINIIQITHIQRLRKSFSNKFPCKNSEIYS